MTQSAVDHTAANSLMSTATSTRAEQVQAGRLFAEFSLRARTLGLARQPLSQVLQKYPTMAVPYAAIHEQYAPKGETIQMLVRVGAPTVEYPRPCAGTRLRSCTPPKADTAGCAGSPTRDSRANDVGGAEQPPIAVTRPTFEGGIRSHPTRAA